MVYISFGTRDFSTRRADGLYLERTERSESGIIPWWSVLIGMRLPPRGRSWKINKDVLLLKYNHCIYLTISFFLDNSQNITPNWQWYWITRNINYITKQYWLQVWPFYRRNGRSHTVIAAVWDLQSVDWFGNNNNKSISFWIAIGSVQYLFCLQSGVASFTYPLSISFSL